MIKYGVDDGLRKKATKCNTSGRHSKGCENETLDFVQKQPVDRSIVFCCCCSFAVVVLGGGGGEWFAVFVTSSP